MISSFQDSSLLEEKSFPFLQKEEKLIKNTTTDNFSQKNLKITNLSLFRNQFQDN